MKRLTYNVELLCIMTFLAVTVFLHFLTTWTLWLA